MSGLRLEIEREFQGVAMPRAVLKVGPVLVCGGYGGEVAGFDLGTGEPVFEYQHGSTIWDLAPVDESTLVAATAEGMVVLSVAGEVLAEALVGSALACVDRDHEGLLWFGEFSGFVHRVGIDRSEVSVETLFTTSVVETLACTRSGLLVTGGSDELVVARDMAALRAGGDPRDARRTITDHLDHDAGPVMSVTAVGDDGWASGGWSGEIGIVAPNVDSEFVMRWDSQASQDSIVQIISRDTHLVSVATNKSILSMSLTDPAENASISLRAPLVGGGEAMMAVCAVDDHKIAVASDDAVHIIFDR